MLQENTKYIFDFGANRGQNLSYYLDRGDVVIAVEANLGLCQEMRQVYAVEVDRKRLFIENYALTDNSNQSGLEVDFYLHKSNSVLSQFGVPDSPDEFIVTRVAQISPSELISRFTKGNVLPYYVKIDLEGFDAQVVRNLFANNIYPDYISAESHSIEVFSALVASGKYKNFKLVDGLKVSSGNWNSSQGQKNSFAAHSAGPFGPDIPGGWMDANTFFKFLSLENLGWKDIHCSRELESSENLLRFGYLWKKHFLVLSHLTYQKVIPLILRRKFSRLIYVVRSKLSH